MSINYISEFIHAGQILEAQLEGRKLNNAYVKLCDEVASDMVNGSLQDCLEDLLIVDIDGYAYTLDEGEIERLLTNAISAALWQMAGR